MRLVSRVERIALTEDTREQNDKRKYRVYTKNGAVSKVNNKFISHLTWAQRTTPAAATVKVSRALPAVRFSCLYGAAGPVSKMAVQQERAFCALRFEVSRSVITVHHAWCVFSKPCTKLTLPCNHRSGHLKAEHTESIFLLRRHLGNWPRGSAASMRSELLVAHEKLGLLLLLTVYVVPV